MAEDDIYTKLVKTLKNITRNITQEELDAASLLVDYLRMHERKEDYEGKQIFPITDYKRRN